MLQRVPAAVGGTPRVVPRCGRVGYTDTRLPFCFLIFLFGLAKVSAFPAVPTLGLQPLPKARGGFWHLALGEAPGVNPAGAGLGVIRQKPPARPAARGSAGLGQVPRHAARRARLPPFGRHVCSLIAFHSFQEPENSNPKHPTPAAMGGKGSKRRSADQI